MNLDLKNKKALVCGSTQGIGKAAAMELANMGASVTLVARNEQSLKAVKAELNTDKGQVHSYLCVDFSQPDKLKELVELYIQRQGVVHILVNNTGALLQALFPRRSPKSFWQPSIAILSAIIFWRRLASKG